MIIAICSGKGGTGKTTVATSLALSLVGKTSVVLMDCDVEAPNAHIFLHPHFTECREVAIPIPQIDPALCTACGKCVEVCQFNALAKVGGKVMVFPQLCHGCGSCTWNCPEDAIQEVPHPIGRMEGGNTAEGIQCLQGTLIISEPMSTPIIRQLKKWQKVGEDVVVIRDAPPGASCAVVETLRGADFALLVTEPTPFGLHDLKQILGILQDLDIPAGVVINRDGIGNDMVDEYLAQSNIPVLMRFPYARTLAEGIASGKTLLALMPQYQSDFEGLFSAITARNKQGIK